MKTFKLTALLLLICNFALYAQTDVFDKLVGTWEYKTAAETFRIVLVKGWMDTHYSKEECLIGGYSYVKNGVTIGNYTQNIPATYTDDNDKITILGGKIRVSKTQLSSNSIWIMFTDKKIGKTTFGFYTKTNNFTLLSSTEARWQIFEDEGEYDPNCPPPPEGFSVPVNVIMKKIK
jgi:hypothetical protein